MALDRFRLTLLPEGIDMAAASRDDFNIPSNIQPALEKLDDIVVRYGGIERVEAEIDYAKDGREKYYQVKRPAGTIRIVLSPKHLGNMIFPAVSIETEPFIPPYELIEDVFNVVMYIIKPTGLKLFVWGVGLCAPEHMLAMAKNSKNENKN